MASIVPISELSKNPDIISKLCHSQDEPVFLTKNGYGDMVVMRMDQYELLKLHAQSYLTALKAEIEKAALESAGISDNSLPSAADSHAQDSGLLEKIPLEDVEKILKKEVKRQQMRGNRYP